MESHLVSILWRRLDQPGHEAARLVQHTHGWRLLGTAVFGQDGRPCRLDYRIECDPEWRTKSGSVSGWLGEQAIEINLAASPEGGWSLNGREVSSVAGCIDLDLNFSPATNLLPICRLQLQPGQEAAVRAAWLRFPGLTLEPLEQRYRRIDERTYRYESAGGKFVRDLQVDPAGFVMLYPDFWKSEEIFYNIGYSGYLPLE